MLYLTKLPEFYVGWAFTSNRQRRKEATLTFKMEADNLFCEKSIEASFRIFLQR